MQKVTQIDIAKQVVRSPSRFYAEFEQVGNNSFPLIYAGGASLLGGAVAGILSLLVGSPLSGALTSTVLIAVLLFGSFVVQALFTHAIVYLLGGRGLSRTIEAMAYPTIWTLPLAIIPLLNFLVGLYGLWLQAKGLSRFHELSGGRAWVALLVGTLFGPGIALVILAAVIGTFILGLGSAVAA